MCYALFMDQSRDDSRVLVCTPVTWHHPECAPLFQISPAIRVQLRDRNLGWKGRLEPPFVNGLPLLSQQEGCLLVKLVGQRKSYFKHWKWLIVLRPQFVPGRLSASQNSNGP
jgi:hypothetical protein